jgi:hypothetical protein
LLIEGLLLRLNTFKVWKKWSCFYNISFNWNLVFTKFFFLNLNKLWDLTKLLIEGLNIYKVWKKWSSFHNISLSWKSLFSECFIKILK